MVKREADLPGVVKVEDAKRWMMAAGQRGAKAASLLGRLSSCRNGKAHPLVKQLIVEVKQLKDEKYDDSTIATLEEYEKDFMGKNSQLDRIGPENAKDWARQIPADTLDVLAHGIVPPWSLTFVPGLVVPRLRLCTSLEFGFVVLSTSPLAFVPSLRSGKRSIMWFIASAPVVSCFVHGLVQTLDCSWHCSSLSLALSLAFCPRAQVG